jgi:outer membrane receptor protein involved in Fe transport
VEALSHRRGRHQLKFGFDIATIHVISNDRLTQSYTFPNLTAYLNTINRVLSQATGLPFNAYSQLQQSFGNNVADHTTNSYNFYAQDDFQLRPGLTLSYGLRYERNQYPSLDPNAPLADSRLSAATRLISLPALVLPGRSTVRRWSGPVSEFSTTR